MFYVMNQSSILFSSDPKYNSIDEKSKNTFLNFIKKYYFNFENNRFFMQFSILYAFVFLIVKYIHQKKDDKKIIKKKLKKT
jgi:hypothetical protein